MFLLYAVILIGQGQKYLNISVLFIKQTSNMSMEVANGT